jgi:CO dehydrogenase nickel-insertion accessory protein CooC1
MQKPCGPKFLVHALAVTGLGGTGKAQLVLHYIEEHKQNYDTILWIDAQDETALRSSFARCCNALSIDFKREQGQPHPQRQPETTDRLQSCPPRNGRSVK